MKGENEETNKVHLSTAKQESGTFSRAKETHGRKNSTHGLNSTGTVPHPKYIEIHRTESITGRRAPERTLVRICAIFEIAMMSPPGGFSPFEEGLLR